MGVIFLKGVAEEPGVLGADCIMRIEAEGCSRVRPGDET